VVGRQEGGRVDAPEPGEALPIPALLVKLLDAGERLRVHQDTEAMRDALNRVPVAPDERHLRPRGDSEGELEGQLDVLRCLPSEASA
jgi:hypothetical protein